MCWSGMTDTEHNDPYRAASRKHTIVRQKHFKRGKQTFVREKCTKYIKINKNSEKLRGQDCC